MSNNDLLKDLERYKANYYNENKKNFFFRKSQKINFATKLCQNFDINQLLNNTVYILPNTNSVYFDYTIFKLYANHENYKLIIEYFLNLLNCCINNYNNFVLHVNLNSFTITAAERYKNAIELFCNECLKSQTRYARMLLKMYLYNSPSIVESVHNIFGNLVDPLVRDRLVIYSKDESQIKLEELLFFLREEAENRLHQNSSAKIASENL